MSIKKSAILKFYIIIDIRRSYGESGYYGGSYQKIDAFLSGGRLGL
jgi:hypothetical protein